MSVLAWGLAGHRAYTARVKRCWSMEQMKLEQGVQGVREGEQGVEQICEK